MWQISNILHGCESISKNVVLKKCASFFFSAPHAALFTWLGVSTLYQLFSLYCLLFSALQTLNGDANKTSFSFKLWTIRCRYMYEVATCANQGYPQISWYYYPTHKLSQLMLITSPRNHHRITTITMSAGTGLDARAEKSCPYWFCHPIRSLFISRAQQRLP